MSGLITPVIDLTEYKVFVLVSIAIAGQYPDNRGFRKEVHKWFDEIGCKYEWLNVLMTNMDVIVAQIEDNISNNIKSVVLNLCDGTEHDGYPGVSLVKKLEEKGIPFTGADSIFYHLTSSKPAQKRMLMQHKVPTSPFVEISEYSVESDVRIAEEVVGYPFIIKLSYAYASIGIETASVCWTRESTLAHIAKIHAAKELTAVIGNNSIFIEKFIIGLEFTALVAGSTSSQLEEVYVYPVVERQFSPTTPVIDRFLTYEKCWRDFADQKYNLAEEELQPILQDIAKRAFLGVKGVGYGRVDMRMSTMADGKTILYTQGQPDVIVLEVNAQPAFSEEYSVANPTANILKLSNHKVKDLIAHILSLGIHRAQLQQEK